MKQLKINKNYLLLKNWWETIDLTNYEKSFFNKEIISLNHEAFDRALFAEGALTAARWITRKKPGLYSMRNVLNFK